MVPRADGRLVINLYPFLSFLVLLFFFLNYPRSQPGSFGNPAGRLLYIIIEDVGKYVYSIIFEAGQTAPPESSGGQKDRNPGLRLAIFLFLPSGQPLRKY